VSSDGLSTDVRQLVGVLEQETVLMNELVDILQQDQQRIVQQDVEGLEAAGPRKEELVLHLQIAEQSRQSLTARIGASLDIAPEDVRVSKICAAMGDEAQPLESAATSLRAVVGGLAELVAVSRGFLEQSILGIRGMLSLIQSMRTPDPATYDASGRMSEAGSPGAMAVRREI